MFNTNSKHKCKSEVREFINSYIATLNLQLLFKFDYPKPINKIQRISKFKFLMSKTINYNVADDYFQRI